MASLMEVSHETVMNWKSGVKEPSAEHARQLERVYGKVEKLDDYLAKTRLEYIESMEKSFHRHEIYKLDKNN